MHASWVDIQKTPVRGIGRTKGGPEFTFSSVKALYLCAALIVKQPARCPVLMRCADVTVTKPFATDVNLPRDPIIGIHTPGVHEDR